MSIVVIIMTMLSLELGRQKMIVATQQIILKLLQLEITKLQHQVATIVSQKI